MNILLSSAGKHNEATEDSCGSQQEAGEKCGLTAVTGRDIRFRLYKGRVGFLYAWMTIAPIMTEHLLADLTEPQRQAVTHTHGPLLVLAGAGSGKTRVITRRVAYLSSTVTQSKHVLALTFTNKAAGEMRERIIALSSARDATVCTFHSLCARLLRRFATRIGLSPSFSIFDEHDRRQVAKQAIATADVRSTVWTPSRVTAKISDLKNQLISADMHEREAPSGGMAEMTLAKIYRCYEQLMHNQHAVDFDDLLIQTVTLLRNHPDVRTELEDRYRYVLIDEYQDTNHAQYLIARGLTLQNENICATGDPDQSIYAWRGANIRNILEFEHDFPNAQIVRLEQNYRSTQRILSAAGNLIRVNQQRKEKDLWTHNDLGEKVSVTVCEDASAEARYVAEDILQYVQNGGHLSSIAVFYRINALSRVFEEAFLRHGIAYQIARGTEFYNRSEIKNVLSYARALINPSDEVAFARAIATPARGIGAVTLQRLIDHAHTHNLPILETLYQSGRPTNLNSATVAKLDKFAKLMQHLATKITEPVEEFLQRVFEESGLEAELERSGDSQDALDNVGELISAASDFTQRYPEATLADWLEQVSLVSDVDRVDRSAGVVTLMTLHAAKGLEFDKVHMIGLEEGILPHSRYQESDDGLEEERRLCFVGMTRAKKLLSLSCAQWRTIHGKTLRSSQSMFLKELPREEMKWQSTSDVEPESYDVAAPSAGFDWPPKPQAQRSVESLNHERAAAAVTAQQFSRMQPGMWFRHPSFGVGQMLWKQKSGAITRAGMRFPTYGEKTLILEHAKLTQLDPDECQL